MFYGSYSGRSYLFFQLLGNMLNHEKAGHTIEVPHRLPALALYACMNDYLPANIQDSRELVGNQFWGNALELLMFSKLFPELKDAETIRSIALYRVKRSTGSVMKDGTHLEPSLNYNQGITRKIHGLTAILGDEDTIPDWFIDFQKRANNPSLTLAGLATPMATLPGVGNQNINDTRPRTLLKNFLSEGKLKNIETLMQQLLKNDTTSRGREAFTSIAFPYGGYYVMREGWGRDDAYLFLRSSREGAGHNHPDNNNIQVFAYGADLLVDRGSPGYNFPHYPKHQQMYKYYFREPRIGTVFMANALSVDGMEQGNPSEKLLDTFTGWNTPRNNLLHFGDTFDLVEGVFDGQYFSEIPLADKNINDLIMKFGLDEMAPMIAHNIKLKQRGPEVLHANHNRKVIFVKPERFWIVIDEVSGEGSTFTQNWNFPPPDKGINESKYFLHPADEKLYYDKNYSVGYSPNEVRFDRKDKRIYTISHTRPNIAILNFTEAPVSYTQHYGEKFPFRGWHSFGIVGEKVPAVSMEATWRGKAPMVTVLYPAPSRNGGRETILDALKDFKALNRGDITGFEFSKGDRKVTVQASRQPQKLTIGDIQADATKLMVYDQGKGLRSGIVLGCKSLMINGKNQAVKAENIEFTIDNNNFKSKAIVPPTTFEWKKNEQGQMHPVYN